MVPVSSLTRLNNGLHELKIEGFFSHPHWVSFLFLALADLRVSVIEGWAVRSAQKWEARFQLDFRQSAALAETLDFVSLASQSKRPSTNSLPRLSGFTTQRLHDQSLALRLFGPDQIGFLGRMLSELSLLALFPIEMEIRTAGGSIQDRLVLRGIAGLPPDEQIEKSLQKLLQSFVI